MPRITSVEVVGALALAGLGATGAPAQPIFQIIPYGFQSANGSPWARSALDEHGAIGLHVGYRTQGNVVNLWRPTSGFYSSDTSGLTMVSEAISANGQVVVGWKVDGSLNYPTQWTLATGVVQLPGGNRGGRCLDTSADGTILVGYGSFNPGGQKPARWVNGAFEQLALPGGHLTGACAAVSADGAVIAATLSTTTPAMWTLATGLVPLALPPGATTGTAQAVSDDGTVIAGTANAGVGGGLVPVKWIAPAWVPVVLDLPTFALDPSATPTIRDMNRDGSMIVGELYLYYPEPYYFSATHSAMWRMGSPAQTVAAFLVDSGMQVEYLTLLGTGISPDGRTLVGLNYSGNEFNPVYQPWFARLPAPHCSGDADGNGAVNFADITNVLTNFNLVCP